MDDDRRPRLRARCDRTAAAALATILVLGASVAHAGPTLTAQDYDRASRFLPDNIPSLVLNARFTPHWRDGTPERFTYRRELGEGRVEFVSVEAATGRRKAAFPHAIVAEGLRAASGKDVDATRLPFQDFEEGTHRAISFNAFGSQWTCGTVEARCRKLESPPASDPLAVPSPDGRWLAYLEGGNLWVRSRDGQERFALTTDAAPGYGYASHVQSTLGVILTGARARALAVKDGQPIPGPPGPPAAPVVLWSPDSSHLLTHRIDEREVHDITLVQSTPLDGSVRPTASSWRYAVPNDAAIARVEPWIFDVARRSGRRVDIDPLPGLFFTPIESRDTWWSNDGHSIYLIARSRYFKSMTLGIIDADSGHVRPLISETGRTFVESASLGERPMVYLLANRELVWFSERGGHGHLYVYDAETGALKRALTSGDWTVRNVLRLDEAAGYIYVSGNEREPGADPYYRFVYRIRLRDGDVTRLTPEDADHDVPATQLNAMVEIPAANLGFSPSGRYFLETHSRADLAPSTVLRGADGKLIAAVESADISRLLASGLTMPERFHTLAADGKTMLYGVVLRPSNFDPSRRYPVIDSPYPGPQAHRVDPRFLSLVFDDLGAQGYAELGAIVVMLDGRGTHGRSKAFHDESYGGLAQAGHLDDHVAAIRDLARRYDYMDLDRVGIFGSSGGGYATAHALATFPDFFKVGVADAGNHDQRGYIAIWGETYNGPEQGDNYREASNVELAKNIRGKLFLLHGDMDSNVLPSQTLQLAAALIGANRDFDLLIVPNAGHVTARGRTYALRRAWDFMVRHLMGAEPPPQYQFPPAPGSP